MIRNGVNVTKLDETVEAVKQSPEIADFKFRARNQWRDGGQNQATVDTFHGTCQEMAHKHPFVFKMDEPPVLLGEDEGANPVELLLSGLSGCMTTTLAYHAAGRGLDLESVSSEGVSVHDLSVYGFYGENNHVWAVIDHNSLFAVGNVPEPSSLALLVIGCTLMLTRNRRHQ